MQLVGVGYRAQAQGKQLNLSLGLSHPVNYPVPEGIEIETPAATEIVVRGCDKQQVGQVCAEIRAYRHPSHTRARVSNMRTSRSSQRSEEEVGLIMDKKKHPDIRRSRRARTKIAVARH